MSVEVEPSILSSKPDAMSYCPGCTHSRVLESAAEAAQRMGLSNTQVCLVSDIGCVGIADQYFSCHTFHGLHGRSITYAEGIKRQQPDLKVFVLIGDGGCGIGSAHLIHAARRNIDIAVLVNNNFNFGMTGGQHSPTTPNLGVTSTTPTGSMDRPFDICATVAANGASYVARCSALDKVSVDHIETALRHPGFAVVDIWELCVPYFVSSNKLNKKGLEELSERLGMPFGVIQKRDDMPRPAKVGASGAPRNSSATRPANDVSQAVALPWKGRAELRVAGSAGQRAQSAVGVIGEIAVNSGLFAAQQNDFPITVRKGHSVSSLIISDQPIRYGGVDQPNLVVILSNDGIHRLRRLDDLAETSLVLVADDVELPPTHAQVIPVNTRELEREAGKMSAGLALIAAGLVKQGLVSADDLIAAAACIGGKYREANLRAIRVGARLRLS